MFISILLIIISLPVQDQAVKKHIFSNCEEILRQAKEARNDKDLFKEIEILEAGINNECSTVSTAFSQLSLCYLEAGDQSYSDRGTKDKARRNDFFIQALEAARISAKLDSTNKFAYEHKAMAFAGILDVNGIKTKVQLADSVRINAEIALEIDPRNDRALHILGRWHYEVSQFGGFTRFFARLFFGTAPKASLDKALEYFQHAAELDDYPVHHYWLGLTYLEMKEKENAKARFEHVLLIEDQHHNDQYFKNKAREHLKDL
jgi:tetratricopeptide (TPR) repeat protein